MAGGSTLPKEEGWFLSEQQVHELLQKNQEDLQRDFWVSYKPKDRVRLLQRPDRELKEMLGLRNHQTCIREAVLLDYYVSGFWWAKEANFTPQQSCFTVAVLHTLLDNIREKHLSLMENLMELTEAVAAACRGVALEEDATSLLDDEEAAALVQYSTNSLLLKHRLFEFLFSPCREELLVRMERTIETFSCQDALRPLEEGVSTHSYSSK